MMTIILGVLDLMPRESVCLNQPSPHRGGGFLFSEIAEMAGQQQVATEQELGR